MNPWIWAIAALVIALGELHAPGYYLIWIAAGAALTAIIGLAAGLTLEAQIGVFAAASLMSCVAGYFIYRKLLTAPGDAAPMNERALEMVGTAGVAAEAFHNGQGKVRLGDSVWLAEGPDMPEGAPVIVVALHGTVVVVKSAPRHKPVHAE